MLVKSDIAGIVGARMFPVHQFWLANNLSQQIGTSLLFAWVFNSHYFSKEMARSSSNYCMNQSKSKATLTNDQLDSILKKARIPVGSVEYQENFPSLVVKQIKKAADIRLSLDKCGK